MADYDYAGLGLKCGIEIHQQLDTHKLFCSCPSEVRDDDPDFRVERKMRAVAGELGNVDPAALHEFLRDKSFIYEGYSGTNCLVELDEEPPAPLNSDALDISLIVSLLLNARPVDELHVMRKTVIDGSNTSGFQRTLLVSVDGFIETEEGRVGIPTICLEEDAARKISGDAKVTVFRLDRLGIPLVEICTAPDIKTPDHARDVAGKLGMILRSTGRVKRGLGTIRQDLNVSITGGERIEVKGVQDLKLISKVVELEVARQLMLIDVMKELSSRGAKPEDYRALMVDMTDIFESSQSKVLRKALDDSGVVLAIKLPCMGGLLKNRLGPELAQYARAIAGVNGIFHSDELPAYGILEEEVSKVKERLKLRDNDAFALVSGSREISADALKAVVDRARIAVSHVPKETRRCLPDGRSEFMRPLPGSARMYPETDEPLVSIGADLIDAAKKNLPEPPEAKLARFVEMGLGNELSGQIIKSRSLSLFEGLVRDHPEVKPALIATALISIPKEIRKKYEVDCGQLTEEHYRSVLGYLEKGRISKEAVMEILAGFAKEPAKDIDAIIAEKNLGLLSEGEIRDIVKKTLENNPAIRESDKGRAMGQLMGQVMLEVRGRADAAIVKKIVCESLEI